MELHSFTTIYKLLFGFCNSVCFLKEKRLYNIICYDYIGDSDDVTFDIIRAKHCWQINQVLQDVETFKFCAIALYHRIENEKRIILKILVLYISLLISLGFRMIPAGKITKKSNWRRKFLLNRHSKCNAIQSKMHSSTLLFLQFCRPGCVLQCLCVIVRNFLAW